MTDLTISGGYLFGSRQEKQKSRGDYYIRGRQHIVSMSLHEDVEYVLYMPQTPDISVGFNSPYPAHFPALASLRWVWHISSMQKVLQNQPRLFPRYNARLSDKQLSVNNDLLLFICVKSMWPEKYQAGGCWRIYSVCE